MRTKELQITASCDRVTLPDNLATNLATWKMMDNPLKPNLIFNDWKRFTVHQEEEPEE